MKLDPVLSEIREVREAYSERFDGNVHAMLEDLRERERREGQMVVFRPAKRIEKTAKSAAHTP